MEDLFSTLSQIQKVEPKQDSLEMILRKIEKENTVSMPIIIAVSAILLMFISVEISLMKPAKTAENYASLVPPSKNILYYE